MCRRAFALCAALFACESAAPQAHYTLSAAAARTSADGAAELTARIVAGESYHVNADFPVSFTPSGSSQGVAFAEARVDLRNSVERIACEHASGETCELRASVPFSITAPGAQRAAGVIAFSVCNDDKCFIEKVPIEADVR